MKLDQTNYFEKLNSELKANDRAIPFLLVDLDKVDQNIDTLKTNINGQHDIRIVVKSLPSFDLVWYAMQRLSTHKLMVFHQPFLSHASSHLNSSADILIGKPMPIKTAQYYYDNFKQSKLFFNPYRQIQWLVDTEGRIKQYIDLAKYLGQTLRLNLEIDVGLHRGGFNNLEELRAALSMIANHSNFVQLSGFMGYDPHVVKIPRLLRSQKNSLERSNTFYEECKKLLQEEFPQLWKEELTFNGAGSPTVSLHTNAESPLNDIAVGSCLVKPSTFDIDSLKEYIPACFIATPILKKLKGTSIPGIEKFKNILNLVNKQYQQSFFIYGGFWKADYCYPTDVKENALFGPSTNQTMINASNSTQLNVDDFVFLRPHQSEFVFLQFGDILQVRNQKIAGSMKIMLNN